MISYTTFMNLILTISVGCGIDYLGRKPIIAFFLLITVFAMVAFSFTSNYFTISFAVVLLDIGTSGAQQAPFATAGDATVSELHGFCMGPYRLLST